MAIVASLLTAISTGALDLNQFGWYRQFCIMSLGKDRLAFIGSTETSGNIFLTDSDALRQCPITYQPNVIIEQGVSPDGKHIAFTTKNGLYTIDANAQNERFLYSLSSANPPGIARLGWSPDSSTITFLQDFRSLARIDLDGSKFQVLVSEQSDQIVTDYSWSPDSTAIVFSVNMTQLKIMGADGNNVRVLSDGTHPLWSPDGKWLAFTKPVSNPPALYVMDRSGGNEHHMADSVQGIAWSPDSKALLFFKTLGKLGIFNQPLVELDKVTLDGTETQRLIDNLIPGDYPAAQSPDGKWIAYISADTEGFLQFYMANSEGNNIRLLSKGNSLQVTKLQWLPNPG
ncbi:MAG: TolB family protein [Aggregatilineales bacterium]